jgi:hypothetical protein
MLLTTSLFLKLGTTRSVLPHYGIPFVPPVNPGHTPDIPHDADAEMHAEIILLQPTDQFAVKQICGYQQFNTT